jgi:putative hydrolase of the HAD superfamily
MNATRAVVFDLGCVVVDWQPEQLIATVAHDAATRARVRGGIFEHADWHALDRGTLSEAEAVQRFARRTGLDTAQVSALLERVAPSLAPKNDTLALIRALRAAGHALYYLSNMAHRSFDYLQRHYDYWSAFAGGVVSCRVGLLKPEPAMYRRLLDGYGLAAAETAFIDDLQPNVDAAAALGMIAIRFTGAADCARALRAAGFAF